MQSDFVTRQRWIKQTAREYRAKPFHPINGNCFAKSVGFARRCRANGIEAKVVMGLGASRRFKLPLLPFRFDILVVHFWTEVDGKIVRTSGPLCRGDKMRRIDPKMRIFKLPSPPLQKKL